jgi:hypothetical protein
MKVRQAESIARPIGPAAWNHTAMMLINPKAMTPSAAPSRLCSGGSSRAVAALRPAARAVPPTSVATARQIAAIARPTPERAAAMGERLPRRVAALVGLRRDVGRLRVAVLTRPTLTLN